MSRRSAALSASAYAGTGRRSGTLPTKIFAAVPDTSAPGSCAVRACSAIDPETPTLTNALPGGSSCARRAGHEPVAGSVAPTPTVSDAPIATYRTAAVAAAEDVTAGLGVTSATADAVGVAGAAVGARDA